MSKLTNVVNSIQTLGLDVKEHLMTRENTFLADLLEPEDSKRFIVEIMANLPKETLVDFINSLVSKPAVEPVKMSWADMSEPQEVVPKSNPWVVTPKPKRNTAKTGSLYESPAMPAHWMCEGVENARKSIVLGNGETKRLDQTFLQLKGLERDEKKPVTSAGRFFLGKKHFFTRDRDHFSHDAEIWIVGTPSGNIANAFPIGWNYEEKGDVVEYQSGRHPALIHVFNMNRNVWTHFEIDSDGTRRQITVAEMNNFIGPNKRV